MINAILILLSYQLVGEILIRILSLPVPGPVVGMLLLFVTLLWRDTLAAKIERTTQYILQNLTLLYVPAAVGVVVHLDLIRSEGGPIIVTLIGSSLVTIFVTAATMNLLLGKFRKHPAGKER